MLRNSIVVGLLAVAIAGCSSVQNTMGRLGVKDYSAKSGQRVMAGQAEPRSEYSCQKLAQERQDWGIKGNMDRTSAMERVTTLAVESAASRKANYAHINTPAQASVMGYNVNAFKDAEVTYYRCANLPPAGKG